MITTTGMPVPRRAGAAGPALHQRIYSALRAEVIRGELRPGEVLSEADLARAWGVSRSPIREALRQLQQDDLVRWSPRRGATVARLTVAGLRDIYEVREALESLSASLAAQRGSDAERGRLAELAADIERSQNAGDYMSAVMLDDELHRLMTAATRNRVLEAQAGRVFDRVMMARMMVREVPGRIDEIVDEHAAIVAALERRDAAAAAQLAARHVRRARARLMETLDRASADHGD